MTFGLVDFMFVSFVVTGFPVLGAWLRHPKFLPPDFILWALFWLKLIEVVTGARV